MASCERFEINMKKQELKNQWDKTHNSNELHIQFCLQSTGNFVCCSICNHYIQ